jgi:hypothetical protein
MYCVQSEVRKLPQTLITLQLHVFVDCRDTRISAHMCTQNVEMVYSMNMRSKAGHMQV